MWETLKNNGLYPYIIATHVLYQYRPDGYKIHLFTLTEQYKKKWNNETRKWDLFEEIEYEMTSPIECIFAKRFDTMEQAHKYIENELQQFSKYIMETLFQINFNPLKPIKK